MGEHLVTTSAVDEEKYRAFMRALLADVWALEHMLQTGRIETSPRIGAEQEMFLIDQSMRPAPISTDMLRLLEDSRFTTELAKFNLEANLTPRTFEGSALRLLEVELEELLAKARKAAARLDSHILLAGILPTLTLGDLTLDNMTDIPRYFELNRMLSKLRRSKFTVHLKGLDEVHVTHDNMMLEACNTSFQVHMQVGPSQFVMLYNIAQAITAPLMAVAVNSPLLFGQRCWAETRIALLQHSVDERSEVQQARFRAPRVHFGDAWVQKSIIEIFREDIARFRVILTHAVDEDPQQVLARGEVPRLSALRLHNGTIWRWNRPCYGITDGQPHLRIENRVLPSGPTVVDEIANAAFFLGLMMALPEEYGPIENVMEFDHAKANFYAAARNGLNTQFQWIKGTSYPATELILNHLLPLARAGLKRASLASEDCDRYLGVIESRVRTGLTGSQWLLKSLAATGQKVSPETRLRSLTDAILMRQSSGQPVHSWPLPDRRELDELRRNVSTVGNIMSTDMFTVRPDDIVDYVASIMHWEHVRHIPVEDEDGLLVGLVSQRNLLMLLAQGSVLNRAEGVPVSAIMKKEVITVTPDTSTLEAIAIMREKKIGCLPVMKDQRLIGMVTLFDLLTVSARLLEEDLRKDRSAR